MMTINVSIRRFSASALLSRLTEQTEADYDSAMMMRRLILLNILQHYAEDCRSDFAFCHVYILKMTRYAIRLPFIWQTNAPTKRDFDFDAMGRHDLRCFARRARTRCANLNTTAAAGWSH